MSTFDEETREALRKIRENLNKSLTNLTTAKDLARENGLQTRENAIDDAIKAVTEAKEKTF